MNIKAYRNKMGMTQTDLAIRLGVTMKTVQNYENNNVTIPKKSIEKIAEIFNVSVRDLYKSDDEKTAVNLLDIDRNEIASFINNNWDYMMESELFDTTFRAKFGEWLLSQRNK